MHAARTELVDHRPASVATHPEFGKPFKQRRWRGAGLRELKLSAFFRFSSWLVADSLG